MANGSKMISKYKCMGLTWVMQGHTFHFNVRLLDLEEYNMVLGTDWMKANGPIFFYFNNVKISFTKEGK